MKKIAFLIIVLLASTLMLFQNCGRTYSTGGISTSNSSEDIDLNPNAAPMVSGGEDKTVNLPTNSVSLTAVASDSDGIVASLQWMQMSGPNTAIVSGQNTETVVASGLMVGVYVFRVLASDDTGNSRTDEVSVFVNAAGNTPPVVNAGNNQSIQLPVNNTTLMGSATDTGGITQTLWSQVSGPGVATIISPEMLNSSITGLISGTYIFQLRATDTAGAATVDIVQVVVQPAPVVAPTCNARLPGANINATNYFYDSTKTLENFPRKTTSEFVCPVPPSAPAKFDPPSYYITGTTTINPAGETHMKPFNDFATKINELGDLYVQSQDPVVANCTLTWLSAWASSSIFNEYVAPGNINYTLTRGDYERVRFVGIWLLNVAKVINTPGISTTQLNAVRLWLGRSMNPIMAFYNNRIRYSSGMVNRPENLNNLQYWAGFTVMLYGTLFNSATHTDWGLIQYRLGVNSIQPDGTLATELAAGANAFLYHQEALQPLVLMAEIQTIRGNNLYTYNNNRLSLLANFIASSYGNFSVFMSKTSVTQSQNPNTLITSQSQYLDWMEIWHSRFNRTELVPYIRLARTNGFNGRIHNRRTGGDITASWGVGTCRL